VYFDSLPLLYTKNNLHFHFAVIGFQEYTVRNGMAWNNGNKLFSGNTEVQYSNDKQRNIKMTVDLSESFEGYRWVGVIILVQ